MDVPQKDLRWYGVCHHFPGVVRKVLIPTIRTALPLRFA